MAIFFPPGGLENVEVGQNLRSEDNGPQTRTHVNGVVINLRVGGSAAELDDLVDVILTDVVPGNRAIAIVTRPCATT